MENIIDRARSSTGGGDCHLLLLQMAGSPRGEKVYIPKKHERHWREGVMAQCGEPDVTLVVQVDGPRFEPLQPPVAYIFLSIKLKHQVALCIVWNTSEFAGESA